MKKIDPNNKKVVIKAILQGKIDLQHASERLRNDKDVVIAAVQQDGLFCDTHLKNYGMTKILSWQQFMHMEIV